LGEIGEFVESWEMGFPPLIELIFAWFCRESSEGKDMMKISGYLVPALLGLIMGLLAHRRIMKNAKQKEKAARPK
jgi:hypothetical protein